MLSEDGDDRRNDAKLVELRVIWGAPSGCEGTIDESRAAVACATNEPTLRRLFQISRSTMMIDSDWVESRRVRVAFCGAERTGDCNPSRWEEVLG
jgi:hypothetical protein